MSRQQMASAASIALASVRWLPRFAVDAEVSSWAVELGLIGGHARKGDEAI
jgi:hypothetical protein